MSEQLSLGIPAGGIARCMRCNAECRTGRAGNPDAKMLRRLGGPAPKGFCADCAVTEWLANTYPVNMIIEESEHGPAILLYPHIQEQFTSIMRTGNADMIPEEINWARIVENWSLPLKVKTSAMNPHKPGDGLKRKLAHMEFADEQAQFEAGARALLKGRGVDDATIDAALERSSKRIN